MSELGRERISAAFIGKLSGDEPRPGGWLDIIFGSGRIARHGITESRSRLATFALWALLAAGGIAAVLAIDAGGATPGAAFSVSIGWYAVATIWTFTHLSMARSFEGEVHRFFYVPNGLSYLRFALGPVMIPFLAFAGGEGSPDWGTVGLVVALALTDMLDGLVARSTGKTSVLGRVLDPLADVVFLFSMTVGLTIAGMIPLSLLILMFFRYPYLLLSVIAFTALRGPMEIRATIIGKVTTATTSTVLAAVALGVLAEPSWLRTEWLEWAILFIHLPITLNLVYLIRWAIRLVKATR